MSLVGACYDTSSGSDSDAAGTNGTKAKDDVVSESPTKVSRDANHASVEENGTKKPKVTLPSASSVIKRRISSDNSVFTSKYEKKEENKAKVLEQHVKMVDNTKNVTVNGKVNGKAVCWMYRRGRCRLGKKCKMYHDSELRDSEAARKAAAENNKLTTPSTQVSQGQKRAFDDEPDPCDPDDERKKFNKKKFGVTDNIVPPKKVIRHLEKLNSGGNAVH